MKTITIFGRKRFEFQKLFPRSIFEGYECNIKFCDFTFKYTISIGTIKTICKINKIKIINI